MTSNGLSRRDFIKTAAVSFISLTPAVQADEGELSPSDLAFPFSDCGLQEEVPSYISHHLVTIFDRSASVSLDELKEMMVKVAEALVHPAFIKAVELSGAVAFSTGTFSSGDKAYRILPTYIISDYESACRVSDHMRNSLQEMTENPQGNYTELGLALRAGYGIAISCEEQLNTWNDVFAHNVRINIVSDFESSESHLPRIRDTILSARRISGYPYITINGLGLASHQKQADEIRAFMRNNIVGGPLNFGRIAIGQENFGQAFRDKIVFDMGFNSNFIFQHAVQPG